MVLVCLVLIAVGALVGGPAVWAAMVVGRRMGALDSPGSPGHVKVLRNVPNTGGVGIFAAVALPMLAAIAAVSWGIGEEQIKSLAPEAVRHIPGLKAQVGSALLFLGALAALHIAGLIDDRRALPAGIKATVMFGAAAAVVIFDQRTRLLTMLSGTLGEGPGTALSILLTVLWITAVTNAMNFIDNMDGLAGGVGAIAGGCFMAAALLHGQWFVAGTLGLLVGGLLGFLWFNRPPARVFMGDGGSLVLGFTLAFLTVRTTYFGLGPEGTGVAAGGWYAVLMPIVVLAVPTYDILSVTAVRLWTGRKPWVASPHHLSHRLVSYGLSKRDAVAVIWGLTAVTGLSGVLLGTLRPWQALLCGIQVILLFLLLAVFEIKLTAAGTSSRSASPQPPTP